MSHLYLISGLGVDHRVFQYLDLGNRPHTYINWIKPLSHESIAAYAKRLLVQITSPHPVIIGLSFGGMMAIEIAKLIPVQQVIVISSAKTKQEIPWYYRVVGKLQLHYLLPSKFIRHPNALVYWLFGITTASERSLMQAILKDSDPAFFKWAIRQIVSWKNDTVSTPIVHIHGTADRLLPYRYIHKIVAIKNGGHFMVVSKAAEVTALLQQELLN
jgi:pimeloyl-ACP methyl ester carboxylesterase